MSFCPTATDPSFGICLVLDDTQANTWIEKGIFVVDPAKRIYLFQAFYKTLAKMANWTV